VQGIVKGFCLFELLSGRKVFLVSPHNSQVKVDYLFDTVHASWFLVMRLSMSFDHSGIGAFSIVTVRVEWF